MVYIGFVIVVIVCYLLGSVNTSIILSKLMGKDIRSEGSGNAGATNMLRSHGVKMGVLTLICDALKGILAMLFCFWMTDIIRRYLHVPNQNFLEENALLLSQPRLIWLYAYRYVGALCVILGHDFPVYFGFRGGKGVATSLGVIFMLDWQTALVVLVISVIVIAITRYVSLGSVLSPLIYTMAISVKSGFFSPYAFNYFWLVFALVLSLLILVKHRHNLERLFTHTESKLGQKGTEKDGK